MKLKITWVPFVLSLVSIMGLRIYQILSMGNAAVRMQWDTIELICFVIAAVSFGIIIFMSYISKDAPKAFTFKKSFLFNIVSSITSALFFVTAVRGFFSYFNGEKDWLELLTIILTFLTAVVVVFVSESYSKQKNFLEKYKLLTLIPVLWSLARVMKLFFEYNSTPTTVINVSTSLSVIFLTFFWFEHARIFSGLFNTATLKKLVYFGFSAVLFITIYLTNYLAVTMDLGRDLSHNNILSIAVDLFVIFYIMCFISVIQSGEGAVLEETVTGDAAADTETTDENESGEQIDYPQAEMSEVDKLIEDIQNETSTPRENTTEQE